MKIRKIKEGDLPACAKILIDAYGQPPYNEIFKDSLMAQLLLPNVDLTREEVFEKYPPRELPRGAKVTRIAPSPTGFMHIGVLYAALISERLGHQSGGVFYLRIEDTDKKREVEGAIELMVNSLKEFGINIDEGEVTPNHEQGAYGPYKQSERKEIYQCFVKKLIEDGQAYPAFETPEELENMNKLQTESKLAPGYYGEWAAWRDKSPDEALELLHKGSKPVIRLKSNGNSNNIIEVEDMFKGKLHFPENNQDIVILKSDGLPTYHFAHIIDDHLMGTTHVLRGDEWLSSLPLHAQLFDRMGWERPAYGHIAPIQKMEGASRRKLSKRYDPEASVSFYEEAGYPPEAVIMYLLTLANWGFEEWMSKHPGKTFNDYTLSIEELKKGPGALLDLQKLNNISKDVVSKLSAEKMANSVINWAKKYDQELASLLEKDINYTTKIFGIERTTEKSRKDIAKWSDSRQQIGLFFDDIFAKQPINSAELENIGRQDVGEIINNVVKEYSSSDSQEVWLEKMKKIGTDLGYAPDIKTFKNDPQKYKGHFGDVAKVIRVLLAGQNKSPDLYEVMRIMGNERVIKRLTAHSPEDLIKK